MSMPPFNLLETLRGKAADRRRLAESANRPDASDLSVQAEEYEALARVVQLQEHFAIFPALGPA
jgi:hypothetical protein